jgi:TRAP-type mannitol/chloroaromatic compound transport system substrate-binding protein
MYEAMGAAVNALAGGDIVPALDRGLIDAAEFNNPSSDRALGFPDVAKVYMMQSFHQSAETFEILFNKKKFDSLPAKLKLIITNAVEAASADMTWKAVDRYSQDYIDIQAKDKVKVYRTPDSILQAQLQIWDKIIAKKSAENPFFKKVLDSQKAFAQRATKWQYDQNVDYRIAVNHYFSAKKKA